MIQKLSLPTLVLFTLTAAIPAGAQTELYDQDVALIRPSNQSLNIPGASQRSGYCCMVMDIDTAGKPKNIRANYCTNLALIKPFKGRASRQRYSPATQDGQAVLRKNYVTKLGRLIRMRKAPYIAAGKNGYFARINPESYLPPPPKKIRGSKWLETHFYPDKPCGELIG